MQVALILTLITFIGGSIWLLLRLRTMFQNRFGMNPVSRWTMAALLASAAAIYWGWEWRLRLIQHHGDVLNGTLIVVVGCAIAAFVLVRNFVNYPVGYGLLATALQLITFPFFAILIPASVVASVVAIFSTRYVYVVD